MKSRGYSHCRLSENRNSGVRRCGNFIGVLKFDNFHGILWGSQKWAISDNHKTQAVESKTSLKGPWPTIITRLSIMRLVLGCYVVIIEVVLSSFMPPTILYISDSCPANKLFRALRASRRDYLFSFRWSSNYSTVCWFLYEVKLYQFPLIYFTTPEMFH